jgi:hypothetical protein
MYVKRNKKKLKVCILVRITRIKIRKIIKKETIKRATKIVTKARNTIKHYIIKTLRYYYFLARTVFEIYWL